MKWLHKLFVGEKCATTPSKQLAFASTSHCWPHPYERLIICNNCRAENCPCDNFCHWCQKIMPDFDDRCAASFTKKEAAHWGYSEKDGWMFDGRPYVQSQAN